MGAQVVYPGEVVYLAVNQESQLFNFFQESVLCWIHSTVACEIAAELTRHTGGGTFLGSQGRAPTLW